MAADECPWPHLTKALAPFIKPRDVAARIRKGFHVSVQQQVAVGDEDPKARFDLLEPKHLVHLRDLQSHLGEVRKSYLRALQAHQTALARYSALKSELDLLMSLEGPQMPWKSFTADYLPLLRKREKLRKLSIIDGALSTISASEYVPLMYSVDEFVRRTAGEQPPSPSAEFAALTLESDTDGAITELKKAVLSTKQNIHDHEARAVVKHSKSTPRSGSESEVAGFQRALNELTAWMEHQLATIGNNEGLATSGGLAMSNDQGPAQAAASLPSVNDLYEQYLFARQNLIQTLHNLPRPFTHPVKEFEPTSIRHAAFYKRVAAAEVILDHVQGLAIAKQEEQSLLRQSVFIRQQIAGADEETARLIVRLAAESHLVQPGAQGSNAWRGAAKEASDCTKAVVTEQLRSGNISANTAKIAISDINKMPMMLDSLATTR